MTKYLAKIGLEMHCEISETNTKVLEFNSAHNISKSDFESGTTIVDIMEKNVLVLKEALN